jgi:hypothetical protein
MGTPWFPQPPFSYSSVANRQLIIYSLERHRVESAVATSTVQVIPSNSRDQAYIALYRDDQGNLKKIKVIIRFGTIPPFVISVRPV